MLSQSTYSSMELLWRLIWRVRDASSDSSLAPLILWPLIVYHFSDCCLWQGHRAHIRTVHPNNWTAVSKETRAKNIKSLYQRERGTAREKWLAEILVYPPSFYTLCCQCLTGSWLSRPGCFCLLSSLSVHKRGIWECVCAFISVMPNDSPAFWASSLIFFLCLLPPWNVTLPGGQMSVFSHCRNKAIMASHLLQYLGQATEVAIGKMLGLPQVQDDSRRTGFCGKVVKIPEWMIVTEYRGLN